MSKLSQYNISKQTPYVFRTLLAIARESIKCYCIKQLLNNIWSVAYVEELMGFFRVEWICAASKIVTH